MAETRRAAVTGREMGAAIARALGLQSTRHIVIDIPLEGDVTVTVTYYPTREEMTRVHDVVQQYRLVPGNPGEGG
jgi:hypothetical protein